VNKSCADASLQTAVEGVAKRQGNDCFNGCNHGLRNTSSPCWIRCFEETILGKEASKPGGALGGMSLESLLTAWAAPFESNETANGGCPALAP
jgi:hypothetical protein